MFCGQLHGETQCGTYRPPMHAPTREIARHLFEEYCAARGGKAVSGELIPAWDDLIPPIAQAWEAVARAAARWRA